MIPYGKKKRGSGKLHSHDKCAECSENVFSKNRGGFMRLAIEEGLAEISEDEVKEEKNYKELYEAAVDLLYVLYEAKCIFVRSNCEQCREEVQKLIADQVEKNRLNKRQKEDNE